MIKIGLAQVASGDTKKESLEIARNIIKEVHEAVGFLHSCITILREFFILLIILVLLILYDPIASFISFATLIISLEIS